MKKGLRQVKDLRLDEYLNLFEFNNVGVDDLPSALDGDNTSQDDIVEATNKILSVLSTMLETNVDENVG